MDPLFVDQTRVIPKPAISDSIASDNRTIRIAI
jgi:hypothetical protein